MQFKVIKKDSGSSARLGEIKTSRGNIMTPVFMPVGTHATVKAMSSDELKGLGTEILLGNTYHLYLKPGHQTIRRLGGLHRFMNWERPILTDSGGYQIFSLSQKCKITKEGASFQSPIDGGASHLLTPELAIEIQEALGADIMMVLDECLPYPSTEERVRESMEFSLDWAKRSLKARKSNSALFGIVQGGMVPDLRKQYSERLISLSNDLSLHGLAPFDGYAIGGLSVGEPIPKMYELTETSARCLPEEKPRYLMGVGRPQDILEGIERGIDMFDCILPTRNARHGTIFTSTGVLHLRNEPFKEDPRPLDENCSCLTCRSYSRAYLRHLTIAKEILSARLCTLHNLHYYFNLVGGARLAILEGRFLEFKREICQRSEVL